jgi:cation transport ATPase
VLPQETVPVDGTLLSTAGIVNGYLLSGEDGADPVKTGDSLFAGTVALTEMEVQVLQPQGQRRIDAWAETAMTGKPGGSVYPKLFARLEARATAMALIGAGALGAFALVRGRGAGGAAEAFFTGVLVFCPCLFASILPLTKQLAHLALLRRGVLLSRTEALLELVGVRHFCFDKTGTLEAVATSFVAFGGGEGLADYLAELGAKSRHPILRGLERLEDREALRGITDVPGLGTAAVTENGDRLLVGRHAYLLSQGVADDPRVDRDFPVVALNNRIVGQVFVKRLYDQKTKKFLRRLLGVLPNVSVTILSGDPAAGAGDGWRAVAAGIGYEGNLSPEEKAAAVQPRSAFVGDGLNDTLALAAADVSFRVGQRVQGFAPVDFQLLSPNLNLILATAAYAKKFRRVLWQTAGAAFLYNCAALVLVALGKFSPLGAVLAMACSFSVLLLSSLRLVRVNEVL